MGMDPIGLPGQPTGTEVIGDTMWGTGSAGGQPTPIQIDFSYLRMWLWDIDTSYPIVETQLQKDNGQS